MQTNLIIPLWVITQIKLKEMKDIKTQVYKVTSPWLLEEELNLPIIEDNLPKDLKIRINTTIIKVNINLVYWETVVENISWINFDNLNPTFRNWKEQKQQESVPN